MPKAPPDRYAPLKDNAWREVAAIDARLERGEISAETPWGGSGKSGSFADWEHARSHIADAIDADGSFLDVGCANGYLLECLPRWTPHRLDRFGVDIAPALVELAVLRLPELADRLYVGNALSWPPPQGFTFIRTGLEYVPRHRRRDLVERLLGCCRRMIIGVFNEEVEARPTEELIGSWGLRVAGRSERVNRRKPEVEYRVLWIDSAG